MDQLDAILAKMALAPVPEGLESMDRAVLARIAASSTRILRAGVSSAAIGLALSIGVISAAMPAREASATSSLTPLGMSPLAPSALLMGER